MIENVLTTNKMITRGSKSSGAAQKQTGRSKKQMREDAIKRAKLSMESDRIKVNALKEKRSGQDASKVEEVKAYEGKNLKANFSTKHSRTKFGN